MSKAMIFLNSWAVRLGYASARRNKRNLRPLFLKSSKITITPEIMRSITNAIRATVLLGVLHAMCSCEGQGRSFPNEAASSPAVAAKGDTVSAIDADILSIHQDRNGNLWFGSDGKGVYRYDGKQTVLFTDKDGLCNNQIRKIREDKAGTLYFSTGKGITCFNGRNFLTLTKGEKATAEDTAKDWEIKPDDLWFEARGGVYRHDGESLKYLQLPRTKLDAEYYSRYPYANLNPYDVYCTFKDSKGNLWMGTVCLGVCRYDGKSFTWFSEATGAAARAVFEDRNGIMWLSNNGLGVFRFDGKRVINFTEEKGLSNPHFVKAISDGSKFVSQEGVLASIMAITDDRNGDLWFGTYDSGAWRYDGKNMTNYTLKDGLSSLSVMAIYKDKKGELWFGTTKGVFNYDGKTFVKFQ